MPFPLHLDGDVYATPQALAGATVDAARERQCPERRLLHAARTGALTHAEAVGLAAALVQSGAPQTVACGARLAGSLRDPQLARLLLIALEALDVGTLLHVDADDLSVEDLLLDAATDLLCAHAIGDDEGLRGPLLRQLRNAGRATSEARLLAQRATADEIRQDLPTALGGGLPSGAAEGVAAGLLRADDAGDAVLAATRRLTPPDREALVRALTRAGAHRARPDLIAALRA